MNIKKHRRLAVITLIGMTSACSGESSPVGGTITSSAADAKEGAMTIRVNSIEYNDYNTCYVHVEEINKTGNNLKTFQISEYEASTSVATTTEHSIEYGAIKDGETRISTLSIAAPNCAEVTEISINKLLCTVEADVFQMCDAGLEYIIEGNEEVKLIRNF